MKLTLCDITALNYWRRASTPSRYGLFSASTSFVPSDLDDDAWPPRRSSLSVAPPDMGTIELLDRMSVVDTNQTTHLLVGGEDGKRRLRGVVCHQTAASLPRGCLYPIVARGGIVDGCFVCSPELAFAQVLRRLTLSEELQLGLELCGSFRRVDGGSVYGCRSLMTSRSFAKFAEQLQGVADAREMKRVARYLGDGSGSAAEAAIVTALSLPRRYGGFGLSDPLLNEEIELNDAASMLLGRSTMSPDARWGDTAFEYDSLKFHSLEEQQEYDERRRNAYAAMGMCVVVGKPRHMRTDARFEAIAEAIYKNAGPRVCRRPLQLESKRSSLLSETLAYWRVDPEEWVDPLEHF